MINEDCFPATVAIIGPDDPRTAGEISSRPPEEGMAYISVARVVVSESEIVLAVDAVQGPQIIFQEAIEPGSHHKGDLHSDSYVTTVSGQKLNWRKDSQCGCGSRLRSWRPFKIMGSSKDPGPND